jgi:hypothetical protein
MRRALIEKELRMHRRPALFLLALLGLLLGSAAGRSGRPADPSLLAAAPALANPILFVTQVPNPNTFATIGSTFGNHLGSISSAPRGGDLWIRYPDGALKNITASAGFGSKDPGGFQGAEAIAVRDPAVSWDGKKAIFSMVVGAPVKQYQVETYHWQLYEVSGLGQGEVPAISKVAGQPANFNNHSPIYGTDGRIIFVSDRPRGGEAHLYPQLDEYELTPVNTGLWSLDPASGDLFLLDHSPSGDFTPSIDSFGRVIFTRWDHLQRDQQADADNRDVAQGNPPTYGTFNYANETAGASYQYNRRGELFPEPRGASPDLAPDSNLEGHTFNFFSPWQISEDGSGGETLNHIGRHELGVYAERVFKDDPNLSYLPFGPRANSFQIGGDGGLFHIRESAQQPGLYYAINAREFGTHSSGQVVTLSGAPSLNADQMAVTPITHPDTRFADDTPSLDHSGLYRDVQPLADGKILVAHTAATRQDSNQGSGASPASRYDFRLKLLSPAANGYQTAGLALGDGLSKTVSYWSPDVKLSYSGPLWELNPVELRARQIPSRPALPLAPPELAAFADAGVDPAAFQAYLAERNLALAVSRNVTVRDDADRQQPFNLRVAGGGVQTIATAGKVYDIGQMQFFQADQLRGAGLRDADGTPREGRRVLAQPLHEQAALLLNLPVAAASAGSVEIAADGSVAAVVPARRAMTWQITDPVGTPVVRERIWVTFQPGEVRVCASCHGLNSGSQVGTMEPQNSPDALVRLLEAWKASVDGGASPLHVALPIVQR